MIRYISILLVLSYSNAYAIPADVGVCFTPDKACQVSIVQEINNSTKSILVQAYSFTDKEVVQALINAHESGVEVRVLLDKSNTTSIYSGMKDLLAAGVPVKIDKASGISHSKVMVIDGHLVITGSYNFSKGAYKVNLENVVHIESEELSNVYTDHFETRWSRGVQP